MTDGIGWGFHDFVGDVVGAVGGGTWRPVTGTTADLPLPVRGGTKPAPGPSGSLHQVRPSNFLSVAASATCCADDPPACSSVGRSDRGSTPIRLRNREPRSFEKIPPSELLVVAKYLLERNGFSSGSDEHLRAVLEYFDLKRLTTQVGTTLLEILDKRFPYVDEFLKRIPK